MDTKTVNVITATAPQPGVENSSVNSSSMHSPAAATGRASQSEEVAGEHTSSALFSRLRAEAQKQPGFEAIFAIIGLMVVVVVWLGLKRRRRG